MASEEDHIVSSEEDLYEDSDEEVSHEEDEAQFKVRSNFKLIIAENAVQCESCLKWRVVSREEYEDIRSKQSEDPFFCNKKPNVSCDDPADIEYDSSKTWVFDRPDIPKAPYGFTREEIMRNDFSKVDIHYVTPDYKKIRSSTEIPEVLKAHPEYKAAPSDFSFVAPRVMSETVPRFAEKKGSASGTKKLKMASEDA